ncbi:MAG: hypothetical protein WBP61_12345 [Nocardioides sp.]
MQPERHDGHHEDDADDRAWKSIVENYGDRAQIDDQPPASPPSDPAAESSTAPFGGRFGDPRVFALDDENEPFTGATDAAEAEERFVPPPPPPLPTVAPDRMLAWAGIFGSPVVLLCALIFSISIPTWLGYLLVMGFVGGFLYLVVRMPREPRDPWDNGAQV